MLICSCCYCYFCTCWIYFIISININCIFCYNISKFLTIYYFCISKFIFCSLLFVIYCITQVISLCVIECMLICSCCYCYFCTCWIYFIISININCIFCYNISKFLTIYYFCISKFIFCSLLFVIYCITQVISSCII